jgi:hypothetical protein
MIEYIPGSPIQNKITYTGRNNIRQIFKAVTSVYFLVPFPHQITSVLLRIDPLLNGDSVNSGRC